ncbi:MAG: NAD-dependent epimerase/dehydratase family protein [Sphingobacteriales bacterium]|nr:MAG: NAD-dependent epimerase/dehydratase family protein [Sphingobacteriales bacterium]TAF81345.1 MAG: NAD-dependent epimerase/dehydratase family protein [Sphingobacteriales bacterium]
MILVTGATGFLGSEVVVQLLQSETKIRCIKRNTANIPPKLKHLSLKIEWLNADMLNFSDLEDAFKGVTYVYHCAAMVSLDAKDKTHMIRNNVAGTQNVVNLCLSYGIKKLIHVSSIAALGKSKSGEAITEEHYWDAFDINNGYAISKYQSEMEVWRGIEEGLNAVIVNPSIILGADAPLEGTGMLFKHIQNGLKYYTDGASGFVDVEDVAKAMIFLANSSIVAQRFIINSQNILYKTLFENIAQALAVAAPTKKASAFELAIAWRWSTLKAFFTGKKAGISYDIAATSIRIDTFSNDKIKQFIDFDFKPISVTISEIAQRLKLVR